MEETNLWPQPWVILSSRSCGYCYYKTYEHNKTQAYCDETRLKFQLWRNRFSVADSKKLTLTTKPRPCTETNTSSAKQQNSAKNELGEGYSNIRLLVDFMPILFDLKLMWLCDLVHIKDQTHFDNRSITVASCPLQYSVSLEEDIWRYVR